jgi:hypothetical protein
MNINIKNYVWIAPFLSFTLGYMVMQHLFRTSDITTPHLVGKQVHEVLPLITKHKLNIRLMDHKEEADLPEGVILNQTPAAGTFIKPNQPLFIVTTKKPSVARAPNCVGASVDQLVQQLQTQGIRPRIYHLPHPYPEKTCFAQSPQPDESLEKNRLILYISAGNNKPIIWPDFTKLPLHYVIEFLDNYGIQPHIINDAPHKEYTNAEYIVTDQRPFAGTLLTLDDKKPLSVQLRVH